MQATTKMVIALASVVLVLFMITLNGNFLFEELIVLYLVPFVPVGTILAIYLLVARIRKRRVSIERRARRLLIYGSTFHCMLLAAILYATWPRYYDKADAVEDIDYFVKNSWGCTSQSLRPRVQEEVRRFGEDLKRRIPGSLGENELFMDISKLGAIVQDAHTGNGYSYFMRRGNLLQRRVFPYKIRFVGGSKPRFG